MKIQIEPHAGVWEGEWTLPTHGLVAGVGRHRLLDGGSRCRGRWGREASGRIGTPQQRVSREAAHRCRGRRAGTLAAGANPGRRAGGCFPPGLGPPRDTRRQVDQTILRWAIYQIISDGSTLRKINWSHQKIVPVPPLNVIFRNFCFVTPCNCYFSIVGLR